VFTYSAFVFFIIFNPILLILLIYTYNTMSDVEDDNDTRSNRKQMHVVYYGDNLEPHRYRPSVYLDGPKTMSTAIKFQWRTRMINQFTRDGFNHVVIIPEKRKGNGYPNYGTHEFYEWEEAAMNMATIVMFWIPRDSRIFPGRDINDRWGAYKLKKNVILGIPSGSEETGYQNWYSDRNDITVVHHLENMVQYVTQMLDQFASLELVVDDGVFVTPPSETLLHNIWLQKLLEQNPKEFITRCSEIHVYTSNIGAMDAVRNVFGNVYQPWTLTMVNAEHVIVIARNPNWEAIYVEPKPIYVAPKPAESEFEAGPDVVDEPTPEPEKMPTVLSPNRLQELLELKKKLGITTADIAAERRHDTVYDKNDDNILDGDNYKEEIRIVQPRQTRKPRGGRRR